MPEVNISINGRIYEIGCDAGQEGRVVDLAAYIDQRLQQIARSGAAYNDAHLMVLTSLVIADELFEIKDSQRSGKTNTAQAPVKQGNGIDPEAEKALGRVLEQLTKRIDGIAAKVQAA